MRQTIVTDDSQLHVFSFTQPQGLLSKPVHTNSDNFNRRIPAQTNFDKYLIPISFHFSEITVIKM